MPFNTKYNLGYATIPKGEPKINKSIIKSGQKNDKSCFYNKSHDKLYIKRFSLTRDLKNKTY